MFLAPDGHEIEIAETAAAFLTGTIPICRLHDPIRPMDAAVRRQIGEMGWFALALPEAFGGSDLSAVEHALFFREVGRQCGPVDLLAQSLAALVDGDDDRRTALTSGHLGVALAVQDGMTLRILGAQDARFALWSTPQETRLLDLTAIATDAVSALDPATPMQILPLNAAPTIALVSAPRVWAMGQLGVAAMLIGIAEATLDSIVEYAKVRETFGRKIGSYQAVRHPCADMALRVEAARSQLWYAATAMKEGRADAGVHLDAAKHLANQAAVANADTNIQLHGGIGVTEEHDAHLFLKHALVLTKLFGARRSLLGRLLHADVET